MDRRTFLATSTALLAAGPALAASGMAYTPGLVQQKLDAGEVVFLDFYTDWCTTCAAQQRVISKLKAENDAYEAITFISVNWDEFKNAELTKSLNIPRRSTLVALSKSGEVGRIVAGTSKKDIKALMDQALALA